MKQRARLRNTRGRSGSSLLETAMWVPFLVMLFVGTVEMARVSYTYYAVQKALYTVARMVGTSVSANICAAAMTWRVTARPGNCHAK